MIAAMESQRQAHPAHPCTQPTASPLARAGASIQGTIGTAFGLLVGWRCGLWLFALLAMSTYLPTPAPTTPIEFFGRTVLAGEANWQLQLARSGYGTSADGAALAAFPPLYALLVRIVALAIPSWALAGTIVSHAALLGALIYLLALFGFPEDRPVALRAGMALLLWPGAARLGTVSPDSTLLLTVVAALYHARRGQWGWVVLWAALAGLTRGMGVLLCVPLLVLWLAQYRARPNGWDRRQIAGLGAVVAAPLAFATFLALLWWQVGSPLAFFSAQDELGFGTLQRPVGLLTLADWRAILANAAPAVRGYPIDRSPFETALIPALVDAGALLVAGLAGVWLLLRSRLADGLFVLIGTLAAFAVWGLPDSPRHLLFLAPLYLVLAWWTSRPTVGYLAAFLSLEVLALSYYLYLNIL